MEVFSVADHFAVIPVVRQRCAGHARFTVMNRRLRIERMRHMVSAPVGCRVNLGGVRVCVADGYVNSGLRSFPDKKFAAVSFRREGNQLYSPRMVLLVFVLLWANDTFAYLTGRLLGKHKLFERISPGKTIEGSIGGLVFTMVGIVVFSHYVDWLSLHQAIGMGLIAVVFGTLGDLCESMLKRQAGVKDSGKLIPGHGGILDRFDSVLFAMPFVFVFLLLV